MTLCCRVSWGALQQLAAQQEMPVRLPHKASRGRLVLGFDTTCCSLAIFLMACPWIVAVDADRPRPCRLLPKPTNTEHAVLIPRPVIMPFDCLPCPDADLPIVAPSSSPRPVAVSPLSTSRGNRPRAVGPHSSLISTDTLAPTTWLASTRAVGGLLEPYSAWSSPHKAPWRSFAGPRRPLARRWTEQRYPPCTEALPLATCRGSPPLCTMHNATQLRARAYTASGGYM